MATRTTKQPDRKGRVPTTWRWDFKFLPVDSQEDGFYHVSVADVANNGRKGIITKRFAHVRKIALSGLAQTVRNVN